MYICLPVGNLFHPWGGRVFSFVLSGTREALTPRVPECHPGARAALTARVPGRVHRVR